MKHGDVGTQVPVRRTPASEWRSACELLILGGRAAC
jgi:hypothetical protein